MEALDEQRHQRPGVTEAWRHWGLACLGGLDAYLAWKPWIPGGLGPVDLRSLHASEPWRKKRPWRPQRSGSFRGLEAS